MASPRIDTILRAAHRKEIGYRAIERRDYAAASSHMLHAAADYDTLSEHETADRLRGVAFTCSQKASIVRT